MCANSAYKASALRPCKNQSANAEPCVRMRLESASQIVNALSVQFVIPEPNVNSSSDGVAPSISQRHTSAAKLMYEKQYYGLFDLGKMLGMFRFKTCDLRRNIS